MKHRDLEGEYALQIRMAGITEPYRQFKAIEGRKFAWDFAWPDYKLLVEVNGGTWVKSGHSSGSGLNRDATKGNLAAINGWFTMTFTGDHIDDGTALKQTQDFFKSKES